MICAILFSIIPYAGGNETDEADPYVGIRFGATRDILLLDVEWHTYESFCEMYKEYADEEWYPEEAEQIKKGELFWSKTVNGSPKLFVSSNPYNSATGDDGNDASQIDPDGYYILNIYPYKYYAVYTDENNEDIFKWFPEDSAGYNNEMEFDLSKDDLVAYCDGLLADGKITREAYDFYYDYYVAQSPLDAYVRQFFPAGI